MNKENLFSIIAAKSCGGMLCGLGGRSVDGDPGSCTGSLHWLACTASLRRRIARPGERETGRMGTVGGLGEPIKGSIVRTKNRTASPTEGSRQGAVFVLVFGGTEGNVVGDRGARPRGRGKDRQV